MKIVLVVAPRRDDFLDGIPRLQTIFGTVIVNLGRMTVLAGDTEYKWVSDPVKMHGFHGAEVEYWGPVHEMKNLAEFKQLERMARLP